MIEHCTLIRGESHMPLHVRWRSAGNGALARLVVCPGYGDHAARYDEMMDWLAERGVSVLAFDPRGHGRSGGRRGSVGRWGEYLDDLTAVLRSTPTRQLGQQPVFLLGHSHGGLIVSAAIQRGLGGVRGVVLSSPFFANALPVAGWKIGAAKLLSPVLPHVRISSGLKNSLMTHDTEQAEESARDELIFRFATPRWYQTMLRAQEQVRTGARKFNMPLLALLAGEDVLSREDAIRAFVAAAGVDDKELGVYQGFYHEILRETQRRRVWWDIVNWIKERA